MLQRIALISMHTCPLAASEGKEIGGMNIYILELARILSRKGFIIDIFTRSQDLKQPHTVNVARNLRVIHLQAGPEKPLPKNQLLQYITQFEKSFLQFTKKENLHYYLLHGHYYLSGLIGLALKKSYKNIPLIINFHTLALMKNLVARNELEREEKERIEAEFRLVKEADHIIVQSALDKIYVEYLYGGDPAKITVVLPGVNRNIFKPSNQVAARKKIGANKVKSMLIFVGRIEPLKGIDVLIYAIKILTCRNPKLSVCLWIVGGDISQPLRLWSKELQRLESLRRMLDITSEVKFVGRKKQEELQFYYNASDLVVIPSHYESFGMATLEAMACGVPVITTDVAGVSDLLDYQYQSLITSASNPLLLAEQIENIITNQNKQKSLSQKVLQKAKGLTWEKTGQEVIAVYKKFRRV